MSIIPRDSIAPVAPANARVEWEEIPCPLCRSDRWSMLLEAPDTAPGGRGLWFAVVQCLDCGLCFTNPRPSPASIAQFYSPVYGPHRGPHRPKRVRWWHAGKERHVLPWHGEGRLLDFGCGGGTYLERMHRQGWQVTGVDISPVAVHRIRTELGLNALVGTLPHPQFPPASFDVITMWHSLEHVHDPLEVLGAAHRLLTPGGRLLVAVPNIDSLPFRWFGRAWYGLDLPRHLTHFAPRTLHLMLERAGFQVQRTRMVRHSHWLQQSAQLACEGPAPSRWHRWLTVRPLSRLTTWYSFFTSQSDSLFAIAER